MNHHINFFNGKIAELVFEEMFHSQGEFEVLHNGYEYTHPEIAQNIQNLNKDFFIRLRKSPDFILISWDKKKKYLVEVKYQSIFDIVKINELAKELRDNYDPVKFFIASPDKFYFDSCTRIMEFGKIDELSTDIISKEIQEEYLRILNEYIKT